MWDLKPPAGLLPISPVVRVDAPLSQNGGFISHCNAFGSEDENQSFGSRSLRKQHYRCNLQYLTLCGPGIPTRSELRGELWRGVSSPEKASGDMGPLLNIPPMATVVFDVQLWSFIDSEYKDGHFNNHQRADVR